MDRPPPKKAMTNLRKDLLEACNSYLVGNPSIRVYEALVEEKTEEVLPIKDDIGTLPSQTSSVSQSLSNRRAMLSTRLSIRAR